MRTVRWGAKLSFGTGRKSIEVTGRLFGSVKGKSVRSSRNRHEIGAVLHCGGDHEEVEILLQHRATLETRGTGFWAFYGSPAIIDTRHPRSLWITGASRILGLSQDAIIVEVVQIL